MGILLKPKPPKKTRMTVRGFLALPPDKHCETELIYGEMIVMPRAKPKHNRAIFYLGQVVDRWAIRFDLGMTFIDNDMILDEVNDLVYAPDLLFLVKKHLDRYRDEKIYGPVDLAVEILSGSERTCRLDGKFADYEKYGISWYWIIDPTAEEPTLREYQLVAGIYKCRSEITGAEWFEPGLFPGLVFRLPQLLAGDLKAAVKGKAKKLM